MDMAEDEGKKGKHMGKVNKRKKKKASFKETETDSLLESIKAENVFIKQLIDCIPPKIYFNADTMEQILEEKHTKVDQKLHEKNLKRKIIEDVSKKSKHHRARLDPMQLKTVTEILEELGKNESLTQNKHSPHLDKKRCNSIDDLKARLSAKLTSKPGVKLSNVDERREKQRQKRRASKLKLKEKRKASKQNLIVIPPVSKKANGTPTLSKPVYNQEGKMVFSRFDFSENGSNDNRKKKSSGKNYKELLTKVQKEGEKLKLLEEKDAGKAKLLKEKKMWQTVLDKAEGIKVKNDPELLKKASKKQDQRKRKSKKDWDKRTESVTNKIAKRQKKRQENLKHRKQEKIKKKIKRAVKRGRLVPNYT